MLSCNVEGDIYESRSRKSLSKITTEYSTDITATSATLVGYITNEGNPAYTERGVCFSTFQNPSIDNNKTSVTGAGTGYFSVNVDGLTPNTFYYVRAYAINSAGTVYGDEVSFKTLETFPDLITNPVTTITATTATLGGNITNAGAPPYTERGVCYSATQNPTVANNKIRISGNGTGNFSTGVSGLTLNTTYYVRAYVINVKGTVYGNQESFTTSIFSLGDGTQIAPYMITTPAQLDAVRNNLSAHYRLGGNVNLTGYLSSGAGNTKWGASGWLPLGSDQNYFTGSFDGAGFKITGLWINRPATADIGLFGKIRYATIQNLGVEIAVANGGIKGYHAVGGVVGYAENNCSIINCFSTGAINSADGITGGVAGNVISSSITNCYSTGTVSSLGNSVGGVAGRVSNSSVTCCYSTCAVNGTNRYVGGVAGYVDNGSVTRCVALNTGVTFETGDHGRVVGYNNAGTLANNWANNTLYSLSKGMNTKDGADCDATPEPIWWTTNGPVWSSFVWYFANGQLPALRWEL